MRASLLTNGSFTPLAPNAPTHAASSSMSSPFTQPASTAAAMTNTPNR